MIKGPESAKSAATSRIDDNTPSTMAGSSDNKGGNNLGVFAAVFTAIFGVTYGAYKLVEGAGSNTELERLQDSIDKLFIEGTSDVEITEALMKLASEQMGDKFNNDAADKIRAWVLEEKITLRNAKQI